MNSRFSRKIRIADPTTPSRRKNKKGSGFMSFPLVAMGIAFVAGFPPISSRLMALDGVMHAHNDEIVSIIMIAAPIAMIVLAITGLLFLYGLKRSASMPHLRHF